MDKVKNALIILTAAMTLLAACSNNPEEAEVAQVIDVIPTAAPTPIPDVVEDAEVIEATEIVSAEELTTMPEQTEFLLPERSGSRTQTTGSVPHVQLAVAPVEAVNDELFRRAYLLPGVEDRPTIISLPGGRGMWLSDDVSVANPGVILAGREFAHIHTDGSLHAPLPVDRALEVAEKGWGEMHPWSGERPGFDGFVMLYTPITMEELEITFQLIVESYNHVTGQAVQASDFE